MANEKRALLNGTGNGTGEDRSMNLAISEMRHEIHSTMLDLKRSITSMERRLNQTEAMVEKSIFELKIQTLTQYSTLALDMRQMKKFQEQFYNEPSLIHENMASIQEEFSTSIEEDLTAKMKLDRSFSDPSGVIIQNQSAFPLAVMQLKDGSPAATIDLEAHPTDLHDRMPNVETHLKSVIADAQKAKVGEGTSFSVCCVF